MKWIDGALRAARLERRLAEARHGKRVVLDERPASWARVRAMLERPRFDFDKLPARTLRAAKVGRLFRSFKLLGNLKRAATPWDLSAIIARTIRSQSSPG